jgi:hypothetical protein
MININNGKISRLNTQKTIDLEDITGTGFIYDSSLWWLVLAGVFACISIILFVSAVVSAVEAGSAFVMILPNFIWTIIWIILYIKSRKTFFFIEYAGGGIRFDSSIYGLVESQDFEKQIRRAKNKVKENILNAMR